MHGTLRYGAVLVFDEDFEAWPWGPVVRNIYFQTRHFERGPVTRRITRLALTPGQSVLNAKFETSTVEESFLKGFLDAVWEAHKRYSDVQLSNATHATGEPWTIVKEKYGDLEQKPTIPNELIAGIFKEKIKNVST